MTNEVRYLLTQEQLNRHKVISLVIDGKLTISEAANTLNLSERQVKRLKKGVITEGPGFLVHKNTGRKPVHAISEEIKEKVLALKRSDDCKDANFLHLQELLERQEGISLSYGSIYNIMAEAGIKSPKTRRRFKPHRRRKRKPQEGLLIQIDATPYEWFGTREKFSLHGAIDDATGKVVGLYLAKHECLQGYFEVVRQIVSNHGIPVSLYSDRHTIFLSPKASKLSLDDQLEGKTINDTQFGRAMKELGISIIVARSAPAKGRVERLWETLQSRLPVEFKLAKVTTIDQANTFLQSYINIFNDRFAVEPDDPQSAYRSLDGTVLIDQVLCAKYQRSVDAGGVFSFSGRHFKIVSRNDAPLIPPRAKVQVLVSPHFGIAVEYKQVVFDALPYAKPNKVKKPATKSENTNKAKYIPPENHYYKYGHTLVKKLTFEDSDRDILKMLEDIFLRQYA